MHADDLAKLRIIAKELREYADARADDAAEANEAAEEAEKAAYDAAHELDREVPDGV